MLSGALAEESEDTLRGALSEGSNTTGALPGCGKWYCHPAGGPPPPQNKTSTLAGAECALPGGTRGVKIFLAMILRTLKSFVTQCVWRRGAWSAAEAPSASPRDVLPPLPPPSTQPGT